MLAVLAGLIIFRPDWSQGLKIKEFHRFNSVEAASRDFSPLFARSYQMAATLHFTQKRPVYKLRGMNRRDFFDFLDASVPRQFPYYLVAEKTDALPLNFMAEGHKVIRKIPVDDSYEIWEITGP